MGNDKRSKFNTLSAEIIDAAIEVHKSSCSGLRLSADEADLFYELSAL